MTDTQQLPTVLPVEYLQQRIFDWMAPSEYFDLRKVEDDFGRKSPEFSYARLHNLHLDTDPILTNRSAEDMFARIMSRNYGGSWITTHMKDVEEKRKLTRMLLAEMDGDDESTHYVAVRALCHIKVGWVAMAKLVGDIADETSSSFYDFSNAVRFANGDWTPEITNSDIPPEEYFDRGW